MKSLRDAGKVLEVHCNDCQNFVEFDARKLPLPDDLAVPEARRHFRCSKCGSRSIVTRPQTYSDRTVAEHRAAVQAAQRARLALGGKSY